MVNLEYITLLPAEGSTETIPNPIFLEDLPKNSLLLLRQYIRMADYSPYFIRPSLESLKLVEFWPVPTPGFIEALQKAPVVDPFFVLVAAGGITKFAWGMSLFMFLGLEVLSVIQDLSWIRPNKGWFLGVAPMFGRFKKLRSIWGDSEELAEEDRKEVLKAFFDSCSSLESIHLSNPEFTRKDT
ncbi:hypothetical protein M422DRAFT_48840 [Sphaerobolus stellatus SS14]|uniref:Uncharacterized protein n=1 Tax=Sphaerobolus stellatus (strain SS14) TaxID=990650 RepID=A0A0C9VSM2_SPHS4|nr:hypothetical protein M422DRAFT_48840 [Sphaerobolus stellatus SS14]